MSVTVRDPAVAAGRYRVSVLVPVVKGFGVAEERWSEPLLATVDEQGACWVDGWQSASCFDWVILGELDVEAGVTP